MSGAEDLSKLAQLMLNKGSYGKWRFFSQETYEKLMPRDLRKENPKIAVNDTWFFCWYGVGIHPFYKPSEDKNAMQYYGHGASSGAVFKFDPKHQMFIVQARDDNKSAKINGEYQAKLDRLVWDSVAK